MEQHFSGWLFLPADAVPHEWRDRMLPLALVPLFPSEALRLITKIRPDVDEESRSIAHLLARGLSAGEIARELHLTRRTVERRIEDLRRRFEVDSNRELATLLARQGL